jgi:Cdc6-like AAA superfamily ATPase
MSDSQNIDEILAHFENNLKLPMGNHMPCLLIVGKDNSSKASIIEHFMASHRNVVRMKTSQLSSLGQFFDSFFDKIRVPYNPHDTLEKKMILLDAYVSKKVNVLILEEFDKLLAKSGRQLIDFVMKLSGELGVAIIATSSGAAQKVIMSDMRTSRLFQCVELAR